MIKILVVAFTFGFINSSFAEQSLGKHSEIFKVDEIKIDGTKKVEPEAILEKLSIKKGMIVDNYALRADIKKIYSMKYFELVEAHHVKEKNKNILKIVVKEKPIISKVLFSGNDEIGDEDLKEQVKTREYNILDVNTIKGDIHLLQ